MKREIKFRGLDAETNSWLYGSLVTFEDGTCVIAHKEVDNQKPSAPVNPESVGQFTGLKDKNGEDIYEGDLVKVWDNYNKVFTKDSAEVIFSHEYVGGWVISNGKHNLNLGTRHNDLIVVGNIHEPTPRNLT